MEDDFRIFGSEELWRPSIFTLDSAHQDSIFDGLRLDVESSLAGKEPQENLFDGLAEDFGLPPLDDVSLESGLDQGVTEDVHPEQAIEQLTPDQPLETDGDNVWDFEAESSTIRAAPYLHTWEAFQFKDEPPPSTHYLSEAGNRAFDAAISPHESSAGVINHEIVWRACCSLVLGRSSTFFQWDPAKKSFTQTLDGVALSGTSLTSSQSLVSAFMQIGTAFRELNAFVTRTNPQDPTALVALKRAVNVVLDQFERYICEQIQQICSLIQLQNTIGRPYSIMMHLCKTVRRLTCLNTDEDIISTLSDEVTCLVESGHFLSGVMQEILARVSMPWLQRLAEDVGLLPGFRVYGGDSSHDDPAGTSERFAEKRILAPEDHRIVSSVKRSIKLLRQHVPDHPLATNDGTLLSHDVLEGTGVSGPESVAQVAEKYKNDMTEAVIRYHQGASFQRATLGSIPGETVKTPTQAEDPFALPSLEESSPLQHQDLDVRTSVYDSLEKALGTALDGIADSSASDIDHVDGSILAPLRPFIVVQANLVNNAVMGYLFRTYNLRAHLELHRSYHLFGNGDFVTRLTIALFSDEVQSAERKRGNIPTSETMGLRLGSRESQRWPPASSELRLTLLDVLTDSYALYTGNEKDSQLPGGLSFAIRELTDAEIDRVMDPTSIYALDFLRLQYTPPEPLADIFTSTIVQHYDSIFRTLLMHVRVLHATSRLCSKKLPKPSTIELQRFAWKARHFATTLFSHFTDTVIAEAWTEFSTNLTALEPSSSPPNPALHNETPRDLPTITHLHETCLDDIRAKMFLRRKHDRIRSAVEQMAGIVVKVAAVAAHGLREDVSLQEQERRFDGLGGEFAGLLEGVASRVGKDAGGGLRRLQSEGDAAGLLLARFRWWPSRGEDGGWS